MLIKTAVQRPVAVLMFFAALVLIGVLSLRRLPVDLLPAINYPNLTVITSWSDTPADDLTRLVTQPLEEVITGLAGVRRVVSRTREGISAITVQYEWGTDMDFANLHLREAIDRVSYREDFPSEADRPLILRWDPGARPIAIMVLGGDDPLSEMTEFARDVVKPALEQIEGISQAEVIGGAEREIIVQPDFAKLRLYGITMENIRQALLMANVSFPGGRIRQGPLHLPLRILGEFESLEEIRATEIPGIATRVTVGDVAQVIDTVKEREGATLLGNHEVVALHLYKELGANTIEATREVDKILGIIKGEYRDFEFAFVYRDAEYVSSSFEGLRDSLIYGAFLAFLVLLLFLKEWRSPLVVGISIPVSILTTFAFLQLLKVNLNLMSLGGLSLAAGMLVDNAIVVHENINRCLQEKGTRWGRTIGEVVSNASQEVAAPVISSTLTTVAVFFPVIYVPGIAGEFFRDQALSVTIALMVSLSTALILQPMLSARMLPRRPVEPRGPLKAIDHWVDRVIEDYHRALHRVMEHKLAFLIWLTVGLAATACVGVAMEKSFLPERARGDFSLMLELEAGTPLEQTEHVAGELSEQLVGMPEVEQVYAQVGQTERTLAALREYTAANTARLRVLLRPSRNSGKTTEAVKARLNEVVAAIPGAEFAFRDEGIGLGEILSSGEAAFTLGVVAEKPEEARAVADDLVARLHTVPGLSGVSMDRVLGNPAVEVTIDREKALRHGLEPDQLARELRSRIQGVVATSYNEIEQRIDIAVRLPVDQRRNLDEVLASPIAIEGGKTVPLGSFTHLSEGRPVREVVRYNQRRQITLSSDVHGRGIGAVWKDVDRLLAGVQLPEGVTLVRGGEQEEISRSFRDLWWALILSALLVYMILAAQFESFLDPFIISTVLPIGVAGALLALFFAGQSINVISIIGLIALLGVVANDAIVKVDAIRRLRVIDGLPGRAAIMEASRLRFRPIVMNTLTAVFGMVPMAIGIGTGEQTQRPLAISIIGGLTFSTVLTLFMTPVIYELIHRRTDRDYRTGRPPAEAETALPGEGLGPARAGE